VRGKRDTRGIPFVKWTYIYMPKELWGWGIKNIFCFFKSLATKGVWHFIQNGKMWGRVLAFRYFLELPKVEWFRKMRNLGENGSIGWKEMMEAFPLIGEGLS